MKLLFSIWLFLSIFMTACSSKNVYEPENIDGTLHYTKALNTGIVQSSRMGAILENNQVLTKKKLLNLKLEEGYNLISYDDKYYYTANNQYHLKLIDKKTKKVDRFIFKKNVLSAISKDDKLALVFSDNSSFIYSIKSHKPLFKHKNNEVITVDSKIAQPLFLNDLVLFPTLNGKVIIVNVNLKKVLKTMIISPEADFNNVIYMNMENNILIAATPVTLFTLNAQEHREELNIRDVKYIDDIIYVLTKEGKILTYDNKLKLIASKKFNFAYFVGWIIAKDKIYLFENEKYVIVLDKNLSNPKVYNYYLNDEKVFSGDNYFINDDELFVAP
jgi:hypothetical protein